MPNQLTLESGWNKRAFKSTVLIMMKMMEVLPSTCPQGQLYLAAASGPGLIPLQHNIYISPLETSHGERF